MLTPQRRSQLQTLVEVFFTSLEAEHEDEEMGEGLVDIFVNPTKAELEELGEVVRGILKGPKLFVWKAAYATHYTVQAAIPEAQGREALFLVVQFRVPGILHVEESSTFNISTPRVHELLQAHPWFSKQKREVLVRSGGWPPVWSPLGEPPIEEAFATSLVSRGHLVDVYVNPSRSELNAIGEGIELRGILKGDQIFVWNAAIAIHSEVAQQVPALMGWDGNGAAYLHFKRGSLFVHLTYEGGYHTQQSIYHLLKNHPWFARQRVPIEVASDDVIDSWTPLNQLGESFYTSMQQGWDDTLADIYSNPTSSELRKVGNSLRGIIDGDEILVWNSNFLTHNEVLGEIGEHGGTELVYLEITPSSIQLEFPYGPINLDTLREKLEANSWLSKFKGKKKIRVQTPGQPKYNLWEAPLGEVFSTSIELQGSHEEEVADLYDDPSTAEIRKLGPMLRGLILHQGTEAKVWDGHLLHHTEVMDYIGYEYDDAILFYADVSPGKIALEIPTYAQGEEKLIQLLQHNPWLNKLRRKMTVEIHFGWGTTKKLDVWEP